MPRQAALDMERARERAMDWTFGRNFQQTRSLLVAERAHELHIAADPVDQTFS
jgi:hypothetical protein